jgi:ABC-type dipeptide/oligopeptide/nickel transport system ATPase subunit
MEAKLKVGLLVNHKELAKHMAQKMESCHIQMLCIDQSAALRPLSFPVGMGERMVEEELQNKSTVSNATRKTKRLTSQAGRLLFNHVAEKCSSAFSPGCIGRK